MNIAMAFWRQPANERRRINRLKVFLPVTIHIDGVTHRAHLLDVSEQGARLHSTTSFPYGSAVGVEWAEGVFAGKVAWTKGSVFGLTFRDSLANNYLLDMVVAR